jgi:Glycosyl transferase family 2
MKLADITPILLTLDEEANLARALLPLSWAREIVVVDSGSRDGTTAIAAGTPNVRLVTRAFDTAARQWNFAVHETGVTSEWVLALDADYVTSPELFRELEELEAGAGVAGFRATFRYCVFGRPLRGSLYPPSIVLFRRELGSYVQDGHTQRLQIAGAIHELRVAIRHDDRKPLAAWLANQARYARLEADKLAHSPSAPLTWPDRVRKLVVVAPFAVFLYCLLWRGSLFDGWAGLFYATQRSVAEATLSLELVRRRLGARASNTPAA